MKFLSIKLASLLLFSLLISCNSNNKSEQNNPQDQTAQAEMKVQKESALAMNTLEIIQFHSTNRCMTCQKIEKLTQGVLKDYDNVEFKLVNVDDKNNEAMAEKFEASGTALFLHNTKTDEFKNLTEFAFMTAGNEDKFYKDLKAEMNKF